MVLTLFLCEFLRAYTYFFFYFFLVEKYEMELISGFIFARFLVNCFFAGKTSKNFKSVSFTVFCSRISEFQNFRVSEWYKKSRWEKVLSDWKCFLRVFFISGRKSCNIYFRMKTIYSIIIFFMVENGRIWLQDEVPLEFIKSNWMKKLDRPKATPKALYLISMFCTSHFILHHNKTQQCSIFISLKKNLFLQFIIFNKLWKYHIFMVKVTNSLLKLAKIIESMFPLFCAISCSELWKRKLWLSKYDCKKKVPVEFKIKQHKKMVRPKASLEAFVLDMLCTRTWI